MSKDGCKVGCKHKERKPKKPHYIPRPWGKPYNYKCFQCPFTCMEKSHLYNHMKYSLCKNSLSLLIESDWPYKKDQLRLQQGGVRSRSPAKGHSEQATMSDEASHSAASLEVEDTEKREAEKEDEESETNTSTVLSPEPAETCSIGARRSKQEAELVMADVFSLEEQLLRARSVEVESKLRHYRLSKTCLSGQAALLSEQWRILSNQTSKPKSDTVASSLPCYPPPVSTGQIECSDTPGFNLSLLGVGYPLAPGLLSYLNPALTTANPSTTPLSFLASSAHSQRHSERPLLPPHLYYPLICEHAFGPTPSSASSETSKLIKPPTVSLQPPSYPPKLSLWKVPALRPSSSQSSPAAAWTSPTCSSPEPSHGVKERVRQREGTTGWHQEASVIREQSLKRTVGAFDSHGAPVEKKPALEFALDSLKNTQKSTSIAALLSSRLPIHNSPRSDGSSPLHLSEQLEARQRGMEREAALLQDFSMLLQEYQHTEQRAASLPEQCHLWAHLGKIRTELSHIQQALERTARSNEGPLDLSVKKDPGGITIATGETKDTGEENCSETEDDDEEEEEDKDDVKNRRKCSLDALMKLNPLVKTEVLSDGGLAIRAGSAEALWHSRTTKCEADSSVLLCSKTPNRPPSIQHLDTLCPSSPLTTTDTMV